MAESVIRSNISFDVRKTAMSSDGFFTVEYIEYTYGHVNTIYGAIIPNATKNADYAGNVTLNLNHSPSFRCVTVPRITMSSNDRKPCCTISLNGNTLELWGSMVSSRNGEFEITYVF